MNDESWRRLIDIGKIAISVAGILTALAYGVLRVSYDQFYGNFGVTLEQVGYSQTDLLYQAIAGPAAYALLYSVIALLGGFITSLIVKASFRTILVFVPYVVAGSLAFTVLLLFIESSDEVTDVTTKGETILHQGINLGILTISVAEYRALPLEVRGDKAAMLLPNGSACLLYLGEAEGIAVLYDVRSRQTERLPTTDLNVVLDLKTEQLSKDCLPPAAQEDEREL